jgi:signal transduction histidine kinase
MTAAEQAGRHTVWEQREGLFYRVAPYGTLALSAVLTAVVGTPPDRALVGTLVIAAAAGAWIFWFTTLHPGWVARRGLMALYYVGLLAFIALLVSRASLFGFFAFTGYLQAFVALSGRWRLAGVAATGMLSATAQTGGVPNVDTLPVWAALVVLNVSLASALSWFGWMQEERSNNRSLIIEELAEANRKLAATVQENVGLHAQLLAQAREAGILDERQRMAREIHDTLAQGLTGIITQLEAAGQARDRRTDWQRHVDTAASLARESLSEARRSVRAVQPEPLETARLPEVLADLVDRWSAINGITAELTCTGTVRRMHPEIEVTLLRTAQEALTNIAKHAAATRAGLTLSYMEDLVTLDVRDDGVGFEPARVPVGGAVALPPVAGTRALRDGGFGLTAMRQRVDRVAGRLEIESEPGGGTAISASVPAVAGTAA